MIRYLTSAVYSNVCQLQKSGLRIVKTYSELGLDFHVEEGYIDKEGYYYT